MASRLRWFAWLVLVVAAFLGHMPRAQAAFPVPPITGHVTDTAGKLTETQRLSLDRKLDAYRACSSNEVAVLVAYSLAGDSIDDVAYKTFNTWKVGQAQKDNGVLLVIAPTERKIRIETGKGIGGDLTDLQSSRIITDHIKPHLKANDTFAAIDDGTTAIAATLGKCTMPAADPARIAARTGKDERLTVLLLLIYGTVVGIFAFLGLMMYALLLDRRVLVPLVFATIVTPIVTFGAVFFSPTWVIPFVTAHVVFIALVVGLYLFERSKNPGPARGLSPRRASRGGRGAGAGGAGTGYDPNANAVGAYAAASAYDNSSSASYGGGSGDSGGSDYSGGGYSGGSDYSGGGGDSGGGGSSDSY